MLRTTSQAIETIKGCLQYLLVDTDELKLDRVGWLLRLAITDLEKLTGRHDTGETNGHRGSLPQHMPKDRLH